MQRIAKGEFTRPILRELEIGERTFRDYLYADDDRQQRYQDAKDEGEEALLRRGALTARGKGPDDGGESSGDVSRDRLILNWEEKAIAKFNPKRQQLELVGKDGGAIEHAVTHRLPAAAQAVLDRITGRAGTLGDEVPGAD